jgi:acyl-coenzyme A synthetase/AMP-(fatty) acid ligase
MTTGSRIVPLSRLLVEGRSASTPVAEYGGAEIDLARFRSEVALNASVLQQCGCRRGLLVTEDAYYGAVGLFALMLAGAEVILPPNDRPGTVAMLAGAWDLVVCDVPIPGVEPTLQLLCGEAVDLSMLQVIDQDTRLVFFTSGSTGTPKRVEKRLLHLEREAESIEALLGQTVPAEARIESTVSHQHVYGLGFRIAWPLATGRSFCSRMHELWETVLSRLGPNTALVTSPAHLNRLDGLSTLAPGQCPSLILSAGAPLSEEAAAATARVLGAVVTEIFGSTETGAIAWRQRATPDPAWQPLPGVAIGKTPDGLISVRAVHVPEDACTGADRVLIDADGGLRFTGRVDRVVKIEGKRVSLVEIEQQLCRLHEVKDAAVIGLGNPISQLAAVVVPSSFGARALAETGAFRFGRRLRHALANTQPTEGLPRRWRFVDQIPQGSLGKRRACDLAALFEE